MSSPAGPTEPVESPQDRRHTQQLISLSQLASERLTMRDALGLLPATIISLVFNAAFVIGLIWYNAGPASGSTARVRTTDELTTIEANESAHHDIIDAQSEELPMNFESMPVTSTVFDPDPTIISPEALPSQLVKSGEDAGKGPFTFEDIARGLPIIGAKPGGPEGIDGPLPGPGDGSGIPTGRGWNPFPLRDDPAAAARKCGGSEASETAVTLGLNWLAIHQSPDGRWSLDKYQVHNPACRCKDLNFEANVGANDTAATAFGVLPMLGAGHHHRRADARFRGQVLKGLTFLMSRQDSRGDLKGGMYGHGLAAIALCEAYGMSSDAKLRVAAQKAIDFIAYAQNDQTGGWHYEPKGVGDTSVVGWQVMALRSGQMAGLNVPAKTLEGARKWLDSVAKEGGSKYAYNRDTPATTTMTAAGLLNRQYLGWGPRNPDLHRGCQYMLLNLPEAKPPVNETLGPIYYYYYATQVMHHMEGRYFDTWNPLMREKLIRLQERDGHKAGSWSPVGTDHGSAGGRLYATSLAILTLEVYYRHMPLYRRADAPVVPPRVDAPKK